MSLDILKRHRFKLYAILFCVGLSSLLLQIADDFYQAAILDVVWPIDPESPEAWRAVRAHSFMRGTEGYADNIPLEVVWGLKTQGAMGSIARAATTWFANVAGSGTASCATLGNACTLGKALCVSGSCTYAVTGGDTVQVQDGTYGGTGGGSGSPVTCHLNVGTAANPVLVTAVHTMGNGMFQGTHTKVDCYLTSLGSANSCFDMSGGTAAHDVIFMGFDLMSTNTANGSNNRTTLTTSDVNPPGMNDGFTVTGGTTGIHFRNGVIHDQVDGLLFNGSNTNRNNAFLEYSLSYNNGYVWLNNRGSGHNAYLQSLGGAVVGPPYVGPDCTNPSNWTLVTGNTMHHTWYEGIHQYTQGGFIHCIHGSRNAVYADGYSITTGWNGGGFVNLLIGANGTFDGNGALSNPCTSGKLAVDAEWTQNFTWQPPGRSAGSVNWGYQKGLFSAILQGNLFQASLGTGAQCLTEFYACGGTGDCNPSFVVASGNNFSQNCSDTIGGAGALANTFSGNIPVSPSGMQTRFPNNTYTTSAIPDQIIYDINPYEAGVGRAVVYNDVALSANVTLNIGSMGAFSGGSFIIVGAQDPFMTGVTNTNQTSGSPIATINNWNGSSTVSVPTSGLTVEVPMGATRGLPGQSANPPEVGVPNETGPGFVVYLLVPAVGSAATPTPTVTSTATQTSTNTPAATNTPTVTPSPTFTNTPTLTGTRTPTATVTNTPTNTQTVTPSPTATPNPNSLSFSVHDSRCVMTGANGSITADSTAIGGYYFSTSVANTGTLTCTINLPNGGIWYEWDYVYAANANGDSLFECVNGDQGTGCVGATVTPTGSNTPTRTVTNTPTSTGTLTPSTTPTPGNTPTWTPNPAGMGDGDTTNLEIYDMASNRGACNVCQLEHTWQPNYQWQLKNNRAWMCGTCAGEGTPWFMPLQAGPNIFAWRGREVGARLAFVILTQNQNFNPNVPTPNAGAGTCPHTFRCKGAIRTIYAACGIPVQNPCPGN